MRIRPRLSLLLASASILAIAGTAAAQGPGKDAAPTGKISVAVMEFEAIGASKDEASAITDRLREELLKAKRMTVVERGKTSELLALQAKQQALCQGSSAQCSAAEIGKVLGINRIIWGKVTKFGPDAWQISGNLVNVETSQTLKTETVRHRGDVLSLLDKAIPQLAEKLGG